MKILVNTRLLIRDKLEGIGWFTLETLKRITVQHPEHQFIFAFDRKYDPEFIFSENVQAVLVPPQARHPLLFYLWFEQSIPRLINRTKPDLFLSQDGYNSLNSRIRSLVVMHDLYFEHKEKDFPYLAGKYLRYYSPRFARKATRIATVSEFSKQDLIRSYGIASDKIDVVYSADNQDFKPLTEIQKKSTRDKYAHGKPYFIYLGALHPRKNLSTLFRAYDDFRKTSSTDIKLLLVGARMWWPSELQNTFEQMQYRSDVILTGRLPSAPLRDLMGSALALTFVSNFEGFGVPVLEAFHSETPVITSNRTSMPEIAGDAALLADPSSAESISDAMRSIAASESLRNYLIGKGRIRREMFSWQKTADLLWNSIEKCME